MIPIEQREVYEERDFGDVICRLCRTRLRDNPLARASHMKKHEREGIVRRHAIPPLGFTPIPWFRCIAMEHAEVDRRCGRDWRCACGACRAARKAGWAPSEDKNGE